MTTKDALKLKIAIAISPRSPPIHLQLVRSGGAKPILSGTTNLPDGAVLQVSLKKPWLPDGQERISIGMAACADGNCLPPGTPRGDTGDRMTIKSGTFQAGPFTFRGAPLGPGVYPIEILIETGNLYGPNPEFFHKVYAGQLIVETEGPAAFGTMSSAERDAISKHVRGCWTRRDGALDIDKQRILLTVTTDANGVARKAVVASDDTGRMSDPRFRAFAELAIRAVMDARCASLPLPSNAMGKVNVLTFRFSP
jgi:hypothetical protein